MTEAASTAEPLAHMLNHPLLPILRGVAPADVLGIADVLVDCGFRVLEVPLNSPSPLDSLARLARRHGAAVMVGAGTVLTAADVDAAADAGAGLILAPNLNPRVVARAVQRGLIVMPGVATATEAFNALEAGALALKLFPADVLGPATFKAWQAVLPAATPLFAVGGVAAGNLADFRRAGASGAGLGSALFQPGMTLDELRRRALRMMAAWTAAVLPAEPAEPAD
jgi:2-dehydro-3-deoxyphosphogalactonate aldolase